MASIYRQLLMGRKKGELGHLWLAAHFPNRIRKQLVEQTNITSSVDKIMVDQLPVVTYRILGFLLLGVVRIYSKKVEYLLNDCNKSLTEIRFYGGKSIRSPPVSESSGGMRRNSFVEAMRPQFSSISLPDNFELDAFDVQVVEDDIDEHVRSHVEVALPDAWENVLTGQYTFSKDRWGGSTSFADHVSDYAPVTRISPSNEETSAEYLWDRFFLDEEVDPMVLSKSDEEVDFTSIPSINNSPDECTAAETLISETTLTALVDNIVLKSTPESCRLSVTITETPQSKVTSVAGERKSDFVAVPVRTPASKEHRRSWKKRKSVYDDILIISNSEYKEWVEDASDLVCKRRRAPTRLIALKKRLSFDCFSCPIIPIKADFASVICTKEVVLEEEYTNTAEPDLSKAEDVASIRSFKEVEGEAIAPITPVSKLTSFRFNEAPRVGPTSSLESGGIEHFPIKDNVDLDEIQTEEGTSSFVEDNYEDAHVAEKWSAVTKSVGSYLHSNFLHKKEKGEEEVLKLSLILKEKTRKESARFFSQILVLKTGGFIDIKQRHAYDDISVMETCKLKEVF